MIKVGILASEQLARAGLRAILERDDQLNVVGTRETSLAGMLGSATDVVVVCSRRGADAEPAVRRLRAQSMSVHVIVVAEHLTPSELQDLLAAGAAGVLRRDCCVQQLPWAVTAVAAGSFALSPEFGRAVVDGYLRPFRMSEGRAVALALVAALSQREQAVLRLLAEGATNPDIGRRLSISAHTVKDHARSVCAKLGDVNRMRAAQIWWLAHPEHVSCESQKPLSYRSCGVSVERGSRSGDHWPVGA